MSEKERWRPINTTFEPSRVVRHRNKKKKWKRPAVPTHLYGSERVDSKSKDRTSITASEIKFMGRTAKYTLMDRKKQRGTETEPIFDMTYKCEAISIEHVNGRQGNRH
jgi:hypothetical protein